MWTRRQRSPAVPRAAVAPAALAVVLMACSGTDAARTAQLPTVTDSAGITIVQNGASESAPTYDLRGKQVLDLGAVDGPEEYLFSWVRALALLDDGGFALADRSQRIRWYDADGTFRRSFGREGDGPGEFQGVAGLWQRDDGTLVAADSRLWRLTVIGGEGVIETYPIRPPGINLMHAGLMQSDSGYYVLTSELYLSVPESGFESVPIIVRLAPLSDQPADTLARVEGPRFGPVHYSGGGSVIANPWFEPTYAVTTSGSAVVFSDCADPEYRELDVHGDVHRVVRWKTEDRTVTDADVEALLADRLAEDETPEDRQQTRDMFDAVPANEIVPTCRDLRGGETGTLWLMTYPRDPTAPYRWLVFEAGELRGSVLLPLESRLLAVGDDRIATVEEGELGVEHIRIYELPEMPT